MLLKSSITLAFWTILSRISGFIRDSVMASFFGTSMVSDAFVAASKLPNSFRRLLGEGALSSVFTVMFSNILAEKKQEEANEFMSKIFSYLLLTLIIGVVIFEIFMPQVISFISPGFAKIPEKFTLTVALARVNFIFIIAICLASICGSALNSIAKFGYFAAMPILHNLGLVCVFFIFSGSSNLAYILSYAIVFIGFFQLFFLLIICNKNKIRPKVKICVKSDEKTRQFLGKMTNGLIGSGIYQINIFVDSIFASVSAGGVSYLYYTDRINQLPLTLIGGTLGVSLLPILSKKLKLGEFKEVAKIHDQCVLFALFAAIFCCSVVCCLHNEIIAFVYERGVFTSLDTQIVGKMLFIFSFGFCFSILSKIYNAFLFANLDTKSPMLIGGFCALVNVIVNFLTYKKYGFFCVVYATLISSILSGILPLIIAHRKKLISINLKLVRSVITLICIGYFTYFAGKILMSHLVNLGIKSSISMLITMILTGFLYCILSLLMRVYKVRDLVLVFGKKV
ncbi:murein biosynthesis integral membrane protein MurJ [Candidatus Deianiraea vastatrix]|uniref:Probable lipid II flippase MurJ n=1 Tax=Candidatus Deianiraea vastatrix TaxID=2163644 RepID=A0A5B8XCR9_9RICK|nr:murein biosynthesis integral membrane protein MurJ [Candidatus Deianiraea vastatrix]QED23112.1 Putative peptidoglycan biosynthesis protein MurJ [Candidatus Deianiraea vastatrix]